MTTGKTIALPRWTFVDKVMSLLFNMLSRLVTEKAMAPHSSTLAWKIPWMEEPGRLQSMGSQRVGHDWETSLSFMGYIIGHWTPLSMGFSWQEYWSELLFSNPGDLLDPGIKPMYPESPELAGFFTTAGIWSHHIMGNRWGNSGNSVRLYFSGLQNHRRGWLQPWN